MRCRFRRVSRFALRGHPPSEGQLPQWFIRFIVWRLRAARLNRRRVAGERRHFFGAGSRIFGRRQDLVCQCSQIGAQFSVLGCERNQILRFGFDHSHQPV